LARRTQEISLANQLVKNVFRKAEKSTPGMASDVLRSIYILYKS